MDSGTIKTQLGLTSYVLHRNAEGLSHQDSLKCPEQGGNCANWVLGHIVRTRNNVVGMLGGKPIFPEEKLAAYGADPVTADSALPWQELLEGYERLQVPLEEGIAALTPERAAQPAPFSPTGNPDETIGSLLAAVSFHEAYHTGQLGILRRVTGRKGAILAPEQTAQG